MEIIPILFYRNCDKDYKGGSERAKILLAEQYFKDIKELSPRRKPVKTNMLNDLLNAQTPRLTVCHFRMTCNFLHISFGLLLGG